MDARRGVRLPDRQCSSSARTYASDRTDVVAGSATARLRKTLSAGRIFGSPHALFRSRTCDSSADGCAAVHRGCRTAHSESCSADETRTHHSCVTECRRISSDLAGSPRSLGSRATYLWASTGRPLDRRMADRRRTGALDRILIIAAAAFIFLLKVARAAGVMAAM